jgi:sec-independent protein translocase protein TatA
MGMIGAQELILICGILILLFGAKKIPDLAAGIGKGIKEFRKATQDVSHENKEQQAAVEQKNASV